MLGEKHGKAIDNLETILAEIDASLGVKKPPAVEFLFVCPYRTIELLGVGFGSPYGHAAIRYTLPQGGSGSDDRGDSGSDDRGDGGKPQKSIVMNIVKNVSNRSMVNFVEANEYLYGVNSFDDGAQQGGAYNRRIVSVRIEEWDDDLVQDLHYFYEKLKRKEQKESVTFNLILGPILNFFRNHLPFGLTWAERGNCARWTSSGLVFSDLVNFPHIWPKQIWINLFERWGRKDRKNVHVVVYEHIPHAKQTYGDGTPLWLESVSPLSIVYNWSYFDLKKFADVVVTVPEGTTKAIITKQENPLEPSFWRWRKTEILGAAVLGGFGARHIYRKYVFRQAPKYPMFAPFKNGWNSFLKKIKIK